MAAPTKKVTAQVKLQIEAGKATPAPPVGPALGQAQVNIMEFCKQFNARTQNKEMAGLIIPVVITVYADRTFTFITKTPPASVLLKKAANLAKGSGTPNKDKVGKVTEKQVLRDRQAEDARPERRLRRSRGQEHQGHRAVHGHRRRRLERFPANMEGQPDFRCGFGLFCDGMIYFIATSTVASCGVLTVAVISAGLEVKVDFTVSAVPEGRTASDKVFRSKIPKETRVGCWFEPTMSGIRGGSRASVFFSLNIL